ncbi:MAG TPA: IS1 family transposase [Thermoanaerobaculia bacterium]|nr:IS1 family transposase [Thermoanaerobaculia bacterium]
MNRLPIEKQVRFLGAIVEGMGVRAACRLTGIAKGSGLRLIREVGAACEAFQRQWIRELDTKRVECDEVWSFIFSKQRQVPADLPPEIRERFGWGDAWTWTAFDSTNKLMITWRVGDRTSATGVPFMEDLASRLKNRIQLSTDGHAVYPEAVEIAFKGDIDYATVIKEYASTPGTTDKPAHVRYSPGVCKGVIKSRVCGEPDEKLMSTSYVERSNLSVRMLNRRFTRLTNSYSKRIEYHRAAIALTFFYYNFCRKHSSLKGKTPAMAAGIATTVWNVRDMLFATNQQLASTKS